MAIKVTNRGLIAGKKQIPLILGAVHYWRIERKLWSEILDKVAGMGFSMIETYIPWSVHEVRRGHFDFGQKKPENDVDAFLNMCHEKNLHVLVRPGPHINSELTYFGFPERVLADKDCQAVTAQNTPAIMPVPPRGFPAPSYASDKFYEETGVWFDAICPILEKHLHPKGPVIAIQADNECSYFMRTNAYDLDYSEGSKKLYHLFLEQKYKNIEALNEVYGTSYSRFSQADMPRRFGAQNRDDLPKFIDWAAYKEYYLIYALAKIRDMFLARGIKNIPVTHNYPGSIVSTPFNIAATEREIDIQGFDMYPQRREYQSLKKGCLAASAQSRLPFIPEFSSGAWLWGPPIKFEDQRFTTLVAFMHGIRGISFYMLVERERWYGAPVARDGRIRQPNYDYYKKLNEIIKRHNLLELDMVAPALLTKARTYQRLESAATILDPAPPLFLRMIGVGPEVDCSEHKFGFAEPIQIAAEQSFKQWHKSLEDGKYPFAIGDTDMSVESMGRYALQIAPTFEIMAADEQARLVDYAKEGGVLVIGPRIPELDDRMAPCEIIGKELKGKPKKLEGFHNAQLYKVGKGNILVTGGLPDTEVMRTVGVEAVAALAGIERNLVVSERLIETAFHKDCSGPGGVLYLANPTKDSLKTMLIFEGSRKFIDLWSGSEINGAGCIDINVPAYTVMMLEVKE